MPWLESLGLARSGAEAKGRGVGATGPAAKKMVGQRDWDKEYVQIAKRDRKKTLQACTIKDCAVMCTQAVVKLRMLVTDAQTFLVLSLALHLHCKCMYISLCLNLLTYIDTQINNIC